MKKTYSLEQCLSEYQVMRSERSEWEAEWKEISDYILPGRGIYTSLSTPRKRKLTSPKAINTIARDALRVLASGIQGGLVPSARPWLELRWKDKSLDGIDFFKTWLYEAQNILQADFQDTNFYPVASSALTEVAGFGTCSIFVDANSGDYPFHFAMLTAGEYVFSTDPLGYPDKMYRILYMTPRNLADRFGVGRCSKQVQDIVRGKRTIQEEKFITVLQCILPEAYQDKPFKQMFWEVGTSNMGEAAMSQYAKANGATASPLEVSGFYEWPAPTGRWETIGQDDYGLGPASEALPEVKRLQEMEKATRMAVHKEIDPPLTAPSYMRGKLKSLPGSKNYYRNPQDKVESIYNRNFNYQGAHVTIERVEEGIKKKFFNDIFLTSARDPNASPMKAAEVNVKEGEKLLRLGSVLERLVPELFAPIVKRCFNINLRKGRFPEIPPEYQEMMGDFEVVFTSPLAQAQKLLAAKSIEQTMAFLGQAAAVTPEAMDKINIDKAVDEFVDAHGTPRSIMNSEDEVAQIREGRAKAQAEAKQKEDAMAAAEMGATVGPAQAGAAKTRAETGEILTNSLVDQQQLGGIM